MRKLLAPLALVLLLSACSSPAPVAVIPEPDGKGPREETLLITEDEGGGKSYEMTTYDEEDTVQFTQFNVLTAKFKSNPDFSMDWTLFYGDLEVAQLHSAGESVLKVAHTGQFEQGGGHPYMYLELAPSGLGGYILYEVPGTYYRLDLQTLALEVMPAPVFAFFGGETGEANDPADLKFLGVSVSGAYEGMSGSSFIITITNLADLTTEEFTYKTTEFGAAGHPQFSPDGQKVAFTASRNNPDDEMSAVLVLDLNTGAVTEITSGAEWYDLTGWSDNETPTYTSL